MKIEVKTFKIMDKLKQDKLLKARQKVEKIKEFYKHIVTYVLVNLFLTFVWKFSFKIFGDFVISNQFTDDGFTHIPIWFIWGVFLVANAFDVYGYNILGLDKNWEERKIKEFLKDDKNR